MTTLWRYHRSEYDRAGGTTPRDRKMSRATESALADPQQVINRPPILWVNSTNAQPVTPSPLMGEGRGGGVGEEDEW